MADFPTFTLTDSADDVLTIERARDAGETVAQVSGVYVRREEAPAVALAVLEAAGAHMLDGAVAQAIVSLRAHLEYRAAQKRREEAERAAREAKEREELDAAALAGLNSFRRNALSMSALDSLARVDEFTANAWREAVKAIHAATKATDGAA